MGELSVSLLQNRTRISVDQPSKVIKITTGGMQGPEGPPPEGTSIAQLDELLSLENSDLLVIFDTSDRTTKHVSLSTLKAFILA